MQESIQILFNLISQTNEAFLENCLSIRNTIKRYAEYKREYFVAETHPIEQYVQVPFYITILFNYYSSFINDLQTFLHVSCPT